MMMITTREPGPHRRPLWQKAADSAAGAVAGSVVETLYNTAAAIRHGADATTEALDIVQDDASTHLLTKAALIAAIRVAAVAIPVATAAGSVVVGAVNGARRGAQASWQEAVMGAFGDAMAFDQIARLPAEALQKMHPENGRPSAEPARDHCP